MKNRRPWKLLLPIGLCAAELMVMACYLYPKAQSGELLSVRHASENLSGILGQSLVTFLFTATLLILFALRLKKDSTRQMYLRLERKWQRITGAALFRFATSDLLGYAIGGCLLQRFKEKSGTL